MSAALRLAARFPFPFSRFDAPRRVDGGELVLERVGVGLREFFDGSDRAKRAHRRAEEGDAGEEQKGFLFSGRWHAARLPVSRPRPVSNSLRCVSKTFSRLLRRTADVPTRTVGRPPNASPAQPPHPPRSVGSAPRPCRTCPASCDADCSGPARTRLPRRGSSRRRSRR